MSPVKAVIIWSAVIIVWAVACASWWWAASRDDYAKLAAARACYSSASQARNSSPQCANIKPTDMLTYKASIDHRARTSRLAAAFGTMVLLILMIVIRRRAGKG